MRVHLVFLLLVSHRLNFGAMSFGSVLFSQQDVVAVLLKSMDILENKDQCNRDSTSLPFGGLVPEATVIPILASKKYIPVHAKHVTAKKSER